MEGLIPLVYKALKKNKTRRKYKCLSSGAAAQSYDISDFYADGGYSYRYPTPQPESRSTNYIGGGGGVHAEGMNGRHHHRRHNSSIGDYSSTGFSMREEEEEDNRVMKSKQLVRFRSSRFFSCVTGTA